MPKMSDTMEEGVVASWLVKVGDQVSSGDIVAEVETDKATMEMENFEDGVILHLAVEAGGAIPVNGLAYVVGDKGEDIAALLEEAPKSAEKSEEPKVEEAVAESASEETAVPAKSVEPVQIPAQAPSVPVELPSGNGDSRTKASPLARKLANEKGIMLSAIKGTGDGGRIVKRDVEAYRPGMAAIGVGPFVPSGQESYEEITVSQMRKTIARRLGESKFSSPHFYLTIELDMDALIEARKHINEASPVKVSFNDLIVKAAALSLKRHPQVNSSWLGDKIRINHHVHIGVAMALPEGLLVPVVRFADEKALPQIAQEVKDYATKAKAKKLQPEDWSGNTFTISNLGMMGIQEFTAIINPPDACIMAVGAIEQKAVVKNGAVVPGNVMKVTMSCDHRAVDGAVGAEFLQTFRSFVENPIKMFL